MDHDLVETFRDKLGSLSDYNGLSGPGLTCYLNSVLQVLFMTPDFRNAVQTCCCTNMETIDPYLQQLFADLEKSQARTHHIAATLAITDVYKQRDAAEYLEKILCLTSPEASTIFRGELSHMTTCSRCEDRNETSSSFWLLPLSVEECYPSYSVVEGLKQFFRRQTVSGDNQMFCNHCREKTDASIKCEMIQSPDVLILLLKRFHFDDKLMRFVKLHYDVDVTHTLQIKEYTYELYALINHSGSLTGGHYTARIRSFDTGAWYDFNDNTVQMVGQPLCEAGQTSVRSRTSYLLMYKKNKKHPDQSEEEDRQLHLADSKQQEAAEKATPPRCHCGLGDGGWSDTKHDGPESEERGDGWVQRVTPQNLSKLSKPEALSQPKSRLKLTEEGPIKSPRGSEDSSPKRRLKTEPKSTSGTRRRDVNLTKTVNDVEGHTRDTRRSSSEDRHRLQPLDGASRGTAMRQKDRRQAENNHRGPWKT